MQRISVIGCPGAGKSVLSARLHVATKLPLIYLDSIYHDPRHNYKAEVGDWLEMIAGITSKEKWIIDGDFVNTFDTRFEASDTIIFLDFPTHVSLFHAIRRRLDYKHHPRLEMPKHWKERLPLEFLGYILTYRKNERPRVISAIEKWKHGKKVIIFKNLKQTEDFLRSVENN